MYTIVRFTKERLLPLITSIVKSGRQIDWCFFLDIKETFVMILYTIVMR
jgi:hypothetical protein